MTTDTITLAPTGTALTVFQPTEIMNPQVLTLVNQYKLFAKASAQNILDLARTLTAAKQALCIEDLDMFCDEVGLNRKSSTYRKLTLIGEMGARFAPHTEQMPAAWTTVYKLALLSDEEFDVVASDSRFSPFMTAKCITAIVKSEKPSSNEADADDAAPKAGSMSANVFSITLDMSALEIPVLRELYKNIQKLQQNFPFQMVLSDDYQMIINHTSIVSPDSAFQMEQAA